MLKQDSSCTTKFKRHHKNNVDQNQNNQKMILIKSYKYKILVCGYDIQNCLILLRDHVPNLEHGDFKKNFTITEIDPIDNPQNFFEQYFEGNITTMCHEHLMPRKQNIDNKMFINMIYRK